VQHTGFDHVGKSDADYAASISTSSRKLAPLKAGASADLLDESDGER
jgi:hypothetical protein